MKNKIIAGIDYSYTSPAICILGEDFKTSKHYFMTGKKALLKEQLQSYYHPYLMEKTYDTPEERWFRICKWAIEVLLVNGVNEVHMEGYAYGSVAGLVFQIAEHAGLLKHYMWRNGIKFNIHAPTSIKKVYTGKGNANKDAMGAKLFESEAVDVSKEFNLKDFGNPASDVVDAYAIALMSKVQN